MLDDRLKWIANSAGKLKKTATVCDFCRRYRLPDKILRDFEKKNKIVINFKE